MKDSLIKVFKSWEFDAEEIGAKLIIALLILLIFFLIARLSRKIFLKLNSNLLSKHPDVLNLLSKIIYYIFLILGYFLFLQVVGLEQYFSKILAGAGIVGIIAGFALKDIASNAFSGLLLFIKKPYVKGDWVQLDGHYGKVELVGWLTTALSNKTGQEIYISNQLIYSGTFMNYSKYKKRRICLQADVQNFIDVPKLKQLLNDETSKFSNLLPNNLINFYVTKIGVDGGFSFELLYWIHFDEGHNFRDSISKALLMINNIGLNNSITIKNITWQSDEEDETSAERFGVGG